MDVSSSQPHVRHVYKRQSECFVLRYVFTCFPQLFSNIIFPSFIISRMGLSLSPRCALITSVAVVVSKLASADSDANGTWLYPDPSTTPTFNYLDTLNASWTSDFSTPWLHLWCGVINGNSSSPVLGQRMTESSFHSIPTLVF